MCVQDDRVGCSGVDESDIDAGGGDGNGIGLVHRISVGGVDLDCVDVVASFNANVPIVCDDSCESNGIRLVDLDMAGCGGLQGGRGDIRVEVNSARSQNSQRVGGDFLGVVTVLRDGITFGRQADTAAGGKDLSDVDRPGGG